MHQRPFSNHGIPGDSNSCQLYSLDAAIEFASDTFYLLLALFYLLCYFSPQVESPSQRLLRACSKEDGSTFGDLEKAVNNDDFIMTRLDDLVRCGYVSISDGRLRTAAPCDPVCRVLAFYQKLFGTGDGG